MSISNIKTVKREPLSVVVYENIKSAIVNGELKPGTRLTETKLSEQLNVSPTPVREAFRKLASEGLIEIIPYRGVIVQEYSSDELEEVYECREALELKAVELAIEKINTGDINKLKDLLEESMNPISHSAYVDINTSIHNIIIRSSNNKMLENLLKQLNKVIIHNRTVSSYSDERKKQIILEHSRIIEALEERDKDKGKKAMKTHIRNGFEYIIKNLPK